MTAMARPALQLGQPMLGQLGAEVSGLALGLTARATELVEPAADDIRIELPTLAPTDAGLALDIYAGVFTLADRMVSTRGRSIFAQGSPSAAFARELHGFAWLRHLAFADTPLARLNAAALIEDWADLDADKRTPILALEPGVVATRLTALLTHADWLLEGATPSFRQHLLNQVTKDFRLLRRSPRVAGVVEIRKAASLVAASIAVPAFRRTLAAMQRRLDTELKQQVLADGGHISRSPSAIVEILAAILPLRAAFAAAGTPASSGLMNAIDRMLPMLRFFIGPTGVLAHFNGAAPVRGELIDSVLAADDTQGRAHGNAAHSGYQRLEAAGTLVVMDCGRPPPMAYAGLAHAGTLSFELTSSTNRLVINCGAVRADRPKWQAVARQTAAHTTVVVGGGSSATPISNGLLAKLTGQTLVGGPKQVTVERREHAGATAVSAGHDGYAASHNLIHERTLRLAATGDRVDGRDLLMPAEDRPARRVPYVVRFHIDPAIQPVLLANGVVMLMAGDGEVWEFHADDLVPSLEDSVYLGDPLGPAATRQIVLTAVLPEAVEQRWTFVRTRGPTLGRG
jgi:uncharacterized heparinase superfamily protein